MQRLCRQFPAESRCGLGIESAEGLTLKIPPSGVSYQNNELTLSFSSKMMDDFNLRLIDLLGQELFNYKVRINVGANNFRQTVFCTSGIQIIQLQNKYSSVAKKFVVN